MADRKYEMRETGLWHKEGGYFVPADEPLCTLRAKDPDSIVAIRAYIAHCRSVYDQTGDVQALQHAVGAEQTLDEFVAFQAAYPGRVRRGCHECG